MIISNVCETKILSTNGGKREDGRYFFSITYNSPNNNDILMEDSFAGLTEERYNQLNEQFKEGSIIRKTVSWENK